MTDVDDVNAATALVFEDIFRGVLPGKEVERGPIRIQTSRLASTLFADPRMSNGWTFEDERCRGDLGSHAELMRWVADLVAREAEFAWAVGIEPIRPPALGREFAFDAFMNVSDRETLCRRLAEALTERLRSSPADTLFLGAVEELRALGHDLWAWGDDAWGRDFITRRPGAGLEISAYASDEEEAGESDEADDGVEVRFRLPADDS